MDRKRRFLYEEWLAVILMWLAAFYLYYLIAFWGTQPFLLPGPLQEYVESGYIHLELILQAFILGVLFNVTNEIVNRSAIVRRSFGSIIAIKSVLYLITIIFAGSLVFIIFYVLQIKPIQQIDKFENVLNWRYVVSLLLYISVAIIAINFIMQINRKFGPGNLIRMLLGRYHKPREEKRIFLFIDLRDSTSIAEQLGHLAYSKFLRHCFHDLTDIVIKYRAEIYQFVGDEVVLSWDVQTGLDTSNCVKTFYAFEKKLKINHRYYMKYYGVFPEFRAGMDLGVVTVAEIGDIKREIAYHGDVLNTASRLQEQCKKYGKKLLVSEHVKSHLNEQKGFILDDIGEMDLRGKHKSIRVFSVDMRKTTN
jgi:adenylate cyclase